MMLQRILLTRLLTPVMAALLLGLPVGAEAAPAKPAAIIEDIQSAAAEFGPLDFLFEGNTITLAEGETLTLAYLRSCIVEEFKGGVVTVGKKQSEPSGGNLQFRQVVDCDGGGIVPTERQGQEVAGVVIRAPDSDNDEPLVFVYATKPIFVFSEPVTELIIARVDPGFEDERRFPVTGDRLDLAREPVELVAGGLYRATTEKGSVLFRVSRRATATSSSVISRLIGL